MLLSTFARMTRANACVRNGKILEKTGKNCQNAKNRNFVELRKALEVRSSLGRPRASNLILKILRRAKIRSFKSWVKFLENW